MDEFVPASLIIDGKKSPDFLNKRKKHHDLEEVIIANESRKGFANYETPQQIADRYGTSLGYIYQVRRELQLRGVIRRHRDTGDTREDRVGSDGLTTRQRRQRRRSIASVTLDLDNPSAVTDFIKDEPVLSPVDRLKILSRIVRLSQPQHKIAAIKAIEELTRSTEGRVGPPPPTTTEDMTAELIRLMIPLPLEVVTAAYDAVTASREEPSTSLQLESPDLPVPSAASAEPLSDLPEGEDASS